MSQRKLLHHHAAFTIPFVITENFDYCAAATFIEVTQRVVRIQNLIHARTGFLLSIAIKVEGMKLNGLCNVVIRTVVALETFFVSSTHPKENIT